MSLQQEPMLERHPGHVLSVPSYLCAVAAGSVVAGALMALRDPLVGLEFNPVSVPLFSVAGLLAGFLPGLIAFLPTTLLSIWLANRLGFGSALSAGLLGALGGAATSGVVSLLLLVLNGLQEVSLFVVAAFAVAGGVGGLVYFLIQALERRPK